MPTFLRLTAVGCLLVGLGGCATLGKQSKDSEQGDSEFREMLNSLKGTGPTAGMSPEARAIENRLGGLQ